MEVCEVLPVPGSERAGCHPRGHLGKNSLPWKGHKILKSKGVCQCSPKWAAQNYPLRGGREHLFILFFLKMKRNLSVADI